MATTLTTAAYSISERIARRVTVGAIESELNRVARNIYTARFDALTTGQKANVRDAVLRDLYR